MRTHDADTGRMKSLPVLLAGVLFLLMAVFPQSALSQGSGKMYWTHRGPNKIQRADLDGSNVGDLVTSGLDFPVGIALDVSGKKMYWVDAGTNKIQRAGLDGTNVEDLVTGLGNSFGIALDVSGGKMYWTDFDNSKIQRANLDGSNVEDLVTTGLSNPFGIALVSGVKMYWTDLSTRKIQRADLDGSNVEDLVTTGITSPEGIALDLTGNKMYWTDYGTAKIQRADLDGSNVEDLVTTGITSPEGIALDVSGKKMYWADADTGKIQRADLDGSNVEDLVTGLGGPSGIALDIPAGFEDYAVLGGTRVTMGNSSMVLAGPGGPGNLAGNGPLTAGTSTRIEGSVQALGDMTFRNGAKVLEYATANGTFQIGTSGNIGGSVNVGGDATLRNGARVEGDLTAGGSVTLGTGASVGGTLTEFGTPEIAVEIALPDCMVTAPGGSDLTTKVSTGPHIVSPGDYGDYNFRGNNRVVFETGVFSFQTLSFGRNTRIELQAPVTIHIADKITFGNSVKEAISGNGGAADVIYILGAGASAKSGTFNELFGTFCGSDATVTLGNGTTLKGAVYADEVGLGRGVKVTDVPADLP